MLSWRASRASLAAASCSNDSSFYRCCPRRRPLPFLISSPLHCSRRLARSSPTSPAVAPAMSPAATPWLVQSRWTFLMIMIFLVSGGSKRSPTMMATTLQLLFLRTWSMSTKKKHCGSGC